MFVKDKTSLRPLLSRADLSDDLCVRAVVVRSTYRISAAGLVPWEGAREPLDTDPPGTAKHAVWQGTSVTVAGTVRGPARPPHLARVDVHVGAECRSVIVLGDRQWLRNAGKLVPSAPAPFDEKPLSWGLAFGGAYELPPGLDPIRKLPHPGGRVAYPLNPGGVGFYRDDQGAEGCPLPSVERREEPIRRREDMPRPAGLAPCPDLVGLRAPSAAPAGTDEDGWHLRSMLRFVHHAPGELIFDDLAPGTAIRVAGVGAERLSFEVPRSPASVSTVRGKSVEAVGFRIRSVHVSADDGAVIVEYAHAFGFRHGAGPAWVCVDAS